MYLLQKSHFGLTSMLLPTLKRMVWNPWAFNLVVILVASVTINLQEASAYSPEHPDVVRMIDRGIAFLRSKEKDHGHHPEGAKMLKAYAIYKVNHDPDDPLVREGVAAAVAYIEKQTKAKSVDHYMSYAGAFAMLLLIDVDPIKHRSAIERMSRYYLGLQKPHGGFGYPNGPEGDNSQNQYAVLSMWSLRKAGFKVPPEVMERLAIYLLQTQDPSGMWGYFGIIGNRGLVRQERTRMSLTSACAGSLLIAGDFFDFYKDRARRKQKTDDDSGLPPALTIHDEKSEQAAAAVKTSQLKNPMIETAVGRAMNFYNKTAFKFSNFPNSLGFYYYALYAHERFMSFVENSRGEYENEPAWYNQGVEDLKRHQDPNGAFGGVAARKAGMSPHLSESENTAFAILFLIRSTKKAIGQLSTGTMQGGYGLPKSTKGMQSKGGQLIDAPKAGSVGGMLDLLEQGGDDVDDKAIYDSLILSKDPQERADQLKRLKRMVKGGPYKTRRAAARMLGQSSDMDIVPTLIFALTDPDKTVQREARNGLRFVSRRFEGFGLPDDPPPKQVEAAVKAWKEWYLLSNPSYIFLDEG
ncbi:hypothetical protein EC9_06760 [Rosistilla ulvae]|uniref:Prenyltransferase and squalene oxidase repeat protein n=2 Tax=Rosistilla ulvae TaxID=1930277 RepID=A0A517LV72_9BACT|nr:hypothetical protein EC9_06760 [Rosistilla ulvae]